MSQVTDHGDLDRGIAFEVVKRGCIWLYCQGDAVSLVVGCDGKKSQGVECEQLGK